MAKNSDSPCTKGQYPCFIYLPVHRIKVIIFKVYLPQRKWVTEKKEPGEARTEKLGGAKRPILDLTWNLPVLIMDQDFYHYRPRSLAKQGYNVLCSVRPSVKDSMRHISINGRMDGRTDGQTDIQTLPSALPPNFPKATQSIMSVRRSFGQKIPTKRTRHRRACKHPGVFISIKNFCILNWRTN